MRALSLKKYGMKRPARLSASAGSAPASKASVRFSFSTVTVKLGRDPTEEIGEIVSVVFDTVISGVLIIPDGVIYAQSKPEYFASL